MNERIQQLALQSKLRPALLLHHWGKIDALTDSEQEELEQLEKFAQLIVQECVRKVRDRGGMCGALASNWIEEHFYGVEE